ncbi:hypothetical protein GCM10028857_22580 [Salinarchaeum chitinilyticum]
MTNVVQSLQRTALDQTDAVAIDADREVSFSELWSKTDQFAGGLRDRDVTVGDAVGICLGSPVEFLVAVYGTLRNGSVPVVIPPSYDGDAIERVAEDTGAQALVVDDRRFLSIVVGIPEIRFAVTVDNEQLLGVDFEAFLGGTGINAGGSRTGLDVIGRNDEDPAIVSYLDQPDDPVGVVRSHGALQAAANAGTDAVVEGSIETHLGCLPLTRPSGLVFGATATIFDGGCYRAVTEWDPRAVTGALYEGEIDRTFLTPEQYAALREEGLEPGHDGVAVVDPLTDAASAPSDGSTRLVATEETGITHVRSPADVQRGHLGTPLDGARVRVADGGERGRLAVTGDTVMDGYFGRPSLTDDRVEEAEGEEWIRTEATGQVQDGEVVLVG